MYGMIMMLTTLIALFALVGLLIGGPIGAALALGVALAMNLAVFWKSDVIILRMYQAEPSNDYKLKKMLKHLAREAGIPVPRLYIIKTTHFIPNAFATGRDPHNAAIAVTGSLLSLKNDEIEAVLAHEIGHIRNRDTLTNMLAATIGGGIAFLAQMGYFYMYFQGGEMRSGSHFTGLLLIVIFAPLAALLIRLAISRQMEYRADYLAALFTKRPRSLARALEKIQDAANQNQLKGNAATSHLWIANPYHGDWFTRLFSTHPPIKDRMKKLLELEGRTLE